MRGILPAVINGVAGLFRRGWSERPALRVCGPEHLQRGADEPPQLRRCTRPQCRRRPLRFALEPPPLPLMPFAGDLPFGCPLRPSRAAGCQPAARRQRRHGHEHSLQGGGVAGGATGPRPRLQLLECLRPSAADDELLCRRLRAPLFAAGRRAPRASPAYLASLKKRRWPLPAWRIASAT
jgi:hypothetical protein